MLNVEQITSELARLPDNALQRYAMMHKDDPYVLSLAMSESNRRKEMRSGAHMQPQPQPTVAQQAIAGMAPQSAMPQGQPMLPEHVGIGALPAQNIQRMAGGGIIGGMDDPTTDGQLEYNNEPVLRMAHGGIAHFDGRDGSAVKDVDAILAKSPYERTPEDNAALEQAGYTLQRQSVPSESGVAKLNEYLSGVGPRIRNYFTAGASNLSDEELAKRPNVGGVMNERILRSLGISPSDTPPGPLASYGNEGRRTATTNTGPVDVPAPVVKPPTPAPARVAAPAPATVPTDYAMPEARVSEEGKQFATPTMGGATQAGQPTGLAALKQQAEIEPFDEWVKKRNAYAGDNPAIAQLERLNRRDAEAKKEKDDALSYALVNMGLTMMAAPAVPGGKLANLFAAAGKGGQAGLASLQEANKALKAAEMEREKMRDSFENMQYAAKKGDLDAYDKYAKDLRDLNERRNEHILTADTQLQVAGVQGQTSRDVANITGRYHLQAQQLAHQAALASPERQVYLAELEKTKTKANPTGDPLKAYSAVLGTKTSEKFNPAQSYADYLKAFAGKDSAEPPMSFAKYASQFGGFTDKPPPGADVLK